MVATWTAESASSVLSTGRNKPVVLDCSAPAGAGMRQYKPFVVKSIGTQLDAAGLARELFGSLLARHLGCNAPEPVLVEIDQATADAVNPTLRQGGASVAVGLAFGSEYLRPLFPLTPSAKLTDEQRADATLLYAFDVLVQNADRRLRNPNCAVHNSRIFAFDFELCFSFGMAIGAVPTWQINDPSLAQMIAEHALRPHLKGSLILDWQPALAAIGGLTANVLDTLGSAVPAAWGLPMAKCQTHILEVVQHIGNFADELRRSVA